MGIVDNLTCPECGSRLLYKQSRYGGFYGCESWRETRCSGSHGAHPDGTPLGVPADQHTKEARKQAHAIFDLLWKGGTHGPAVQPKCRIMSRRKAYRWMQEAMCMTPDEAHIGSFTISQCQHLMDKVRQYLILSQMPDLDNSDELKSAIKNLQQELDAFDRRTGRTHYG